MANGPVAEAGQTARSLIDAFRGQPLSLALVVMNLALLGLLYWSAVVAERERTLSLKLLYENRTFVGNLLARCSGAPNQNP